MDATRIAQFEATTAIWERFPPKSFLDANVIIDWMRLDVFDDAIPLLPQPASGAKRWRVTHHVEQEAKNAARRNGWFSPTAVDVKLGNPNIQRMTRQAHNSQRGKKITVLRQRMEQEELQRNPDANTSPVRHLGEAETIVMMLETSPEAVFVTNDGPARVIAEAEGLAATSGTTFISRLLTAESISDALVWYRLCNSRACHPAQHGTCHAGLACPDVRPEAFDPGANPRALSMTELFDTALDELVRIENVLP